MYAVIETGGKQYRVSEGDVITVEKLKVEIDSEIAFDKVLLIGDAGNVEVGTPYLDAARVFGSVVDAGKGKKVIIFKYKAKKDYRKKQGHRQPYTSIRIDAISADGKPVAKKTVAKVNDAAKTKEAEETAVLTETVEQAAEKAVEKKPAEKKPAAKKAESAEKKPAAKKTEEKKPATAKKNAAAETEKQPVAEKPAADVPVVEDVKNDVEKTAEKAE